MTNRMQVPTVAGADLRLAGEPRSRGEEGRLTGRQRCARGGDITLGAREQLVSVELDDRLASGESRRCLIARDR